MTTSRTQLCIVSIALLTSSRSPLAEPTSNWQKVFPTQDVLIHVPSVDVSPGMPVESVKVWTLRNFHPKALMVEGVSIRSVKTFYEIFCTDRVERHTHYSYGQIDARGREVRKRDYTAFQPIEPESLPDELQTKYCGRHGQS